MVMRLLTLFLLLVSSSFCAGEARAKSDSQSRLTCRTLEQDPQHILVELVLKENPGRLAFSMKQISNNSSSLVIREGVIQKVQTEGTHSEIISYRGRGFLLELQSSHDFARPVDSHEKIMNAEVTYELSRGRFFKNLICRFVPRV